MGTLYIVATPIGNMEDITLRAIRILSEADIIACEDTRHTGMLLKKLNIKNKLISLHEYSDRTRIHELITMLKDGKNIAFLSDAGTPLVSDPGFMLVKTAHENNIKVSPVPGASALICAVCSSGIVEKDFVFLGFLEKSGTPRKDAITFMQNNPHPVIFYESPKRILRTLLDLSQVIGSRQAAICREMTKMYEEIIVDSIENLYKKFENTEIRGEIAVVIDSAKKRELSDEEILDALNKLKKEGFENKKAVEILSSTAGIGKNRIKKLLIDNM